MKQFRPGEIHVALYEQLVQEPEVEVERLFAFLGIPYHSAVLRAVARPSLTSRRDSAIAAGENPTQSWMQRLGGERLERGSEIIRQFGLDRLYSHAEMPEVGELSSLMQD